MPFNAGEGRYTQIPPALYTWNQRIASTLSHGTQQGHFPVAASILLGSLQEGMVSPSRNMMKGDINVLLQN
jgi:hypothetical protein